MDERHRQSMTVSAKTVDDAIAEAERELGVPRAQLDITVITEGSKGFLGMRAENARILAMVVGGSITLPDEGHVLSAALASAPAAPAPVSIPPSPTRDGLDEDDDDLDEEDEDEDDEEYDREETEDGVAVPTADQAESVEAGEPGGRALQRRETAVLAQEILETILRQMDIQARVNVSSTSDPIVLSVATDEGGLLIGRRGETLSALQYMVNVLIGRRTRGWTKIIIDVEGWRARREQTLRALALRQADRVRQQQRPIALDPMPANERRIVHMALQDLRDIATHSEGEEPNRRLVITLKQ